MRIKTHLSSRSNHAGTSLLLQKLLRLYYIYYRRLSSGERGPRGFRGEQGLRGPAGDSGSLDLVMAMIRDVREDIELLKEKLG